MNTDSVIIELQRLAQDLYLQDFKMMHSAGGTKAIHDYVQRMIKLRINQLQHQQEATQC
ncbi:hypothetical protein [Arsukibacterium sp.]|uniref:hypothetical protein n=1 Tax=Arsukibacterium sp. TaxID=1977258 RepID=UPI00299D4B50|nr:hypothetical protein [Arsukibacterium sp.]MDX1538854.1 hypothetical protein [Arsukibacterium sp.]